MARKRSPKGKKLTVFLAALVRDEEALRLRKCGCSYRQIDDALKYGGESNAARAVKRRTDALKSKCDEAAEQVRQLEIIRLDAMLRGLWDKAESGDAQAVATVLRIQERRTAYQGLDAPKLLKVELERELAGHIEKLKAGLAPDVFEQVLAVLAGEHGPSAPGADPSGPGEEDDRGSDEPG